MKTSFNTSAWILLPIATVLTFMILLDFFPNPSCPMVWNGGSPVSNRGTCWCGSDRYCMCTPVLTVSIVILSQLGSENSIWLGKSKIGLIMPGGPVRIGESVEESVFRYLSDYNIHIAEDIRQLCVLSTPSTLSEQHRVTLIFLGNINSEHQSDALVSVPLDEIKVDQIIQSDKEIMDHFLKKCSK